MKDFVPYVLALQLKELGFDEHCFASFTRDKKLQLLHYDNELSLVQAPTFSQSFRFFREKYNIECYVKSLYEQRENKGYYFGLDDYTNRDFYSKPYYSFEEAELECLKKLIAVVS